MAPTDRYIVISSDGHAGGNHAQYREYLDPAWRDEFDAWRGGYKNPFRDLQDDGRTRNWDTERRNADLDAEGVAAEVLFPNTVPAVLPDRRRHRPGPDARGVPPSPRRPAGPQPLAGRLRRRGARAPRRPGPGRPQRRRRGREGRLLGQGAGPLRHPAARRLARHPLDRPALLADLRPVLGRLPGDRHVDHPPRRRQWHPELRQAPVVDDDVRARVGLVGQPGAVAPHHVRRLRPLPRPQVRHDRAGLDVGARRR